MDHWSFLLFIDRWLLRVFRLHRQKLRRLLDYYGSLANEEFLFLSFFLSFFFSAMARNEIFFFLPSTGCLVDDAIPGENRSSPPSRRRSKT